MAPDLVYRFDMDKEESTEIHIKTIKSAVNIKFEYHITNPTEGGTNFASIDESLANLDMHVSSDKKLSVTDLQTIKDFIDDNETSDTVKNIQERMRLYYKDMMEQMIQHYLIMIILLKICLISI